MVESFQDPVVYICTLDAVGSSQIFFPTQNLERAYQVDKESEAVLQYFQYDQNSNLIVKNKHNVGLEIKKFNFWPS